MTRMLGRVAIGLLSMLMAAPLEAQTVTGARFTLTTGPCTIRSGSGAPSSGLGVVCDTYYRTDSPYTVYVKTGASTWSPVVVEPGSAGITTVGTLTSGAIGAAFGAIDVGADAISGGAISGTTGAFSTSVTTPSLLAAANLTLAPTGDLVVNPTGNDVLPTTNYDINLGALTTKFLTLHAAELWVETLVAQDTMATIGGRVLVGPTTTLTANLAAAATSIQVKHNQIANGDRLVLQANGQLEWLAVTSGASGSAGAYIYSVTRNLDGSGANDWVAGDAVFNTGTTGDGYIDLYSVNGILPGSTVGPTVVGNVRTGTTYSNVEPRWAIGNLNGLYGYSSDTYGTAFGSPSAAWVKIDPTNGIRIGHNATTKIELDASGNASFVQGAVTIDENGIRLSPETGGLTFVVGSSYSWSVTGTGAEMGTSGTELGGANVLNLVNIAPSGKGASIELTAYTAGGTSGPRLIVQDDGVQFGNDLIVFENNGSTTARPYIRSDGNYLLIDSRSTANGGTLYLNGDTNAATIISSGGGATTIGSSGATATIYNASMHTSLTLNGLASCTLAVNGSGAVGCVSDGAAKTAITPWAGGLDVVAKLKPVSYRWKEGDSDRHIGFIAQDVEDVIPDAVRRQRWGGDLLTLDDRAILAALVNAVQELQRRVR